ncbi:hypothetical protein PInf_008457 [Phytophthora infestans]|nr:hypothetical protein PInf_008457 [Phytophthora infestans]
MPRGTAKSGAKTRSKAAGGKAQAKSTKPHGKGSALQEATQVASEAIDSSGDAAVGKRPSKRRSPSPSATPDNRPNPRLAEREFDSGSEDEADQSPHGQDANIFDDLFELVNVGDSSVVETLRQLVIIACCQELLPRTSVRSESPAVKAKGTPKAGGDEEEKPRKRLSLAEGLAPEGAKPSKKRMASKSSLHEKKKTRYFHRGLFDSSDEENEKKEEEGAISESRETTNDLDQQQEDFQATQRVRGSLVVAPVSQGAAINSRGYWPPEESSGSDLFLELLVAPRGLVGGQTSRGVYERTLVQKEQLFADSLEAARCVLLAPHHVPLKDFTTCRKKPENRGGLYPL